MSRLSGSINKTAPIPFSKQRQSFYACIDESFFTGMVKKGLHILHRSV
jgi:hypothetical protein